MAYLSHFGPGDYNSFLDSPTVELRIPEGRSFKIHLSLLEQKGGTISRAFRHNFKEKEDGYTFQETSEETLVKFIEWAYRGDYSDTKSVEESATKEDEKSGNASIQEGPNGNALKAAHPVLCHMRVLVFANTYDIWVLKVDSKIKLQDGLKALGPLSSQESRQLVLDILRLAFSNFDDNDEVLSWLARYMVWALADLRSEDRFHELLPKISRHLFKELEPCKNGPWDASRNVTPAGAGC